jgi:hypothetical protein
MLIGHRGRRMKQSADRGNWNAASVNTTHHPINRELVSIQIGALENFKGLLKTLRIFFLIESRVANTFSKTFSIMPLLGKSRLVGLPLYDSIGLLFLFSFFTVSSISLSPYL